MDAVILDHFKRAARLLIASVIDNSLSCIRWAVAALENHEAGLGRARQVDDLVELFVLAKHIVDEANLVQVGPRIETVGGFSADPLLHEDQVGLVPSRVITQGVEEAALSIGHGTARRVTGKPASRRVELREHVHER